MLERNLFQKRMRRKKNWLSWAVGHFCNVTKNFKQNMMTATVGGWEQVLKVLFLNIVEFFSDWKILRYSGATIFKNSIRVTSKGRLLNNNICDKLIEFSFSQQFSLLRSHGTQNYAKPPTDPIDVVSLIGTRKTLCVLGGEFLKFNFLSLPKEEFVLTLLAKPTARGAKRVDSRKAFMVFY